MSLFAETPIERLFCLKGSFIVYTKLSPEEQALLGAPQFSVGQTVVVPDPWWWRNRHTGAQMRPNLKCVVTSANPYFHRHGSGGGYSVDVRDANNPGAHARMVSECDIMEFVPNPLYPPK